MNNAIYQMAKQYYNEAGYFKTEVRDILMKKLGGQKITKEDDKALTEYCLECQKKQLERKNNDLSIREMKNTIFKLIGRTNLVSNSRYSQSTVSKTDMLAIYQFVTALPAEFLAEDKCKIGSE